MPTHPRYPAFHADAIWSDEGRALRLRRVCDWYTINAMENELVAAYSAPSWGEQEVYDAPGVDVALWKQYEKETGHEIVGFLKAYMVRLPQEIHPYVHFGLTSSDLVEYELHSAVFGHVSFISTTGVRLLHELSAMADDWEDQPRAGRTHGQTAEHTTVGHQFRVHAAHLERLIVDLGRHCVARPVKSVGPVGNSTIRESLEGDYLFEVPSFQIIPRDFLTGWASDYLRLASFLEGLANFVRLGSRSEINELREGKTGTRQGSSAMPGKENPIDSEKVVGLARIARGYHLALSEVSGSLWEERDLSNSSTERIAVPGLAATVEHMLETMLNVVVHLQINVSNMNRNARDPRCVTNLLQTQEQSKGLDPIAASKKVKEENERRNGS